MAELKVLVVVPFPLPTLELTNVEVAPEGVAIEPLKPREVEFVDNTEDPRKLEVGVTDGEEDNVTWPLVALLDPDRLCALCVVVAADAEAVMEVSVLEAAVRLVVKDTV